MTFVEFLKKFYGITWYQWDEYYSPIEGQGKEIMERWEAEFDN